MPNPTSSPESGVLTGPDPSRGPPAWAGFRVDVGAPRPSCCQSISDSPHMSGFGQTLVYPVQSLCDSSHMSGFGQTLVHPAQRVRDSPHMSGFEQALVHPAHLAAKVYVTRRTCLVSGRRWCTPPMLLPKRT